MTPPHTCKLHHINILITPRKTGNISGLRWGVISYEVSKKKVVQTIPGFPFAPPVALALSVRLGDIRLASAPWGPHHGYLGRSTIMDHQNSTKFMRNDPWYPNHYSQPLLLGTHWKKHANQISSNIIKYPIISHWNCIQHTVIRAFTPYHHDLHFW